MADWLRENLGETLGNFTLAVIALLTVLFLIALFVRLWRHFSASGFGRHGPARLSILEAMAIDNKRRLVLVRRDAVEHLIMIGGTSDLIIESGIHTQQAQHRPSQANTPQTAARPATAPTQQKQAPTLVAPQATPNPAQRRAAPTVTPPQPRAEQPKPAAQSPTVAPTPRAGE